MKKILVFIIFLYSTLLFSQKKYSFDYKLVYKELCSLHQKPMDYYVFLNSKNNNYTLLTNEKINTKNTTDYSMRFLNSEGESLSTDVNKVDFNAASTFTSECSHYILHKTHENNLVKDYVFENLNDTIINDTVFSHFIFKNIKKEKYRKKHNIGVTHYIAYKNDVVFLPSSSFKLQYMVWKKNQNIPNGLIKYRYYIDYKGSKTSKIELNQIIKLNTDFIIPKECEKQKIVIE